MEAVCTGSVHASSSAAHLSCLLPGDCHGAAGTDPLNVNPRLRMVLRENVRRHGCASLPFPHPFERRMCSEDLLAAGLQEVCLTAVLMAVKPARGVRLSGVRPLYCSSLDTRPGDSFPSARLVSVGRSLISPSLSCTATMP